MRAKRNLVLVNGASRSRVWAVLLLLIGFQTATAVADTLHYWRFEDSPGFLSDSAGSGDLVSPGIADQSALAATGRGMYFTGLPGGNARAADVGPGSLDFLAATIPTLTGDFTAEAFVHFDAFAGTFGDHIVGLTAGGGNWSWTLQVRFRDTDDWDDKELLLGLFDGSDSAMIRSNIIMETGKDYYVAAAVNLSGREATIYVRNLTDAGPLQAVTGPHTMSSLHPLNTLSIGGFVNSNYLTMDGLVEEVRISNAVLAPGDLLVANLGPPVDPVPEPSTLILVVTGCFAGAWMWRRRRA